jgi:hypothetical protein
VLAVAACTASARLAPLMLSLGTAALGTGCVLALLLADAYRCVCVSQASFNTQMPPPKGPPWHPL